MALLGCLFACPLVQACRLSRVALLSWVVRSSGRMFPAFCPLYCFMLVALLANVALFRVFRAFLARFMRFVWVCVDCVVCVACGAFVRVWG